MEPATFAFTPHRAAHGHPQGRAEGFYRRLDTNGSGGLDAAEAAQAGERSRLATSFGRIDADGDGEVTRDELRADFRTYRRDGTARATPEAPTGASPQSLFEALASSVDQDGDIRLSQQEIASSPLSNLLTPVFGSIDADGDGLLSSREVDGYEAAQAALASGAVPEAEIADEAGETSETESSEAAEDSDNAVATSSDAPEAAPDDLEEPVADAGVALSETPADDTGASAGTTAGATAGTAATGPFASYGDLAAELIESLFRPLIMPEGTGDAPPDPAAAG